METSNNNGRRKFRVIDKVFRNPDTESYHTLLYTVKVQVRILGIWVTVWTETCGHSDGDTRKKVYAAAEQLYQFLTKRL